MSKTHNLGPVRITETDKIMIQLACDKAGTNSAAKIRELMLAWARKVLK